MARLTVQFGLAVMLFIKYSSTSSMHDRSLSMTDHCKETQHVYHHKGFNGTTPSKPVSGLKLDICPQEYSCCTREMEKNFKQRTSMDVTMVVKERCSSVRNSFSKKHKKFDDFFQKLIENARTTFDDLFFRTYGELYSSHSEVFMQLFKDLKSYYRGEAIDLSDVFGSFFAVVTQKVFQLINPNYIMDDDYMQCIADNMNTIQPLDTIPETMTSQMQRAFIIAKTFVRSLDTGRTVAQHLAEFTPSADCEVALTRMTYCSACQAIPSTRPCHEMCMSIMKGCLVDYKAVNKVWKEYIDAMHMLLSRLDSPFNIESVLHPLDVKISEAVMTLQENKRDLTTSIFSLCGVPKINPNATAQFNGMNMMDPNMNYHDSQFPPFMDSPPDFSSLEEMDSIEDFEFSEPGRNKRSAEKPSRKRSEPRGHGGRRGRHERHLQRTKGEKKTKKVTKKMTQAEEHRMMLKQSNIEKTRYKYSEEQDAIDKEKHASAHTALGTNLATLVSNAKRALAEVRELWETLPSRFCKSAADESNSTTCWNEKTVGIYGHSMVTDSFKRYMNNEVDVDHQRHPVVDSQINELRKTTSEMKNAYKGVDSQRGVDDDDSYQYSGDGSADGSGDIDGDELPSTTLRTMTLIVCPDCGGGNSLSQKFIPVLTALLAASWLVL